MTSSTLIKSFERAKEDNRAALLTYTVGGDPDKKTSLNIFKSIAESGADIIECGLGHGANIGDGGAIQDSTYRALSGGIKTDDIFEIIEDFKNKTSGIKKIRNKIKSLELNIYLRDQVLKEVDYFSMLNSVETRVPFLSKKVLFYSSLPDAQNTISKKLLINDLNFFKNKKYKKIPFLIEDLIMKNYKSKMINKAKNLII